MLSTALPPTARALIALMLTWWIPGALLVGLWRLPGADGLSKIVLALGLGLCWLILIALGLHALPGGISRIALLVVFGGGNLLLAAALGWTLRSVDPAAGNAAPIDTFPSRSKRLATLAITLALLLLAGTLRLYGLGYHEFHRDEVSVLQRAQESIAGDEAALAAHYKGPGEILITSTVYRAVGAANETTARLPFALASVASVVAIFALGRALHSTALGAAAGVLLAINGFAVGLSRIDQYQGVMLLLMTLAVLAGWHFARSGQKKGGARWLVLTAVLSAFGVVMHYEFALMTPLLLVLVWQGWRRSERRGAVVAGAATVGVLGAVLVLGTYLPVLRNDNFEQTQGYPRQSPRHGA